MKQYYQAWSIVVLSLFLSFGAFSKAHADEASGVVTGSVTGSEAPGSMASKPSSGVGESVTKPSDYFGQIMLSLVLVLAIIFLAAWLLRRYGRFPGVADGHLKVLGALSVGQRERILLLQVGSEQILVGVTTSKITTLHQLEEPVKVKDNAPLSSTIMSTSFSQRLQEALKPKDATKTTRVDS